MYWLCADCALHVEQWNSVGHGHSARELECKTFCEKARQITGVRVAPPPPPLPPSAAPPLKTNVSFSISMIASKPGNVVASGGMYASAFHCPDTCLCIA